MKFSSQSLFFVSLLSGLTNYAIPVTAHGDHSASLKDGNNNLLPRYHNYQHKVRGRYAHSQSPNILATRQAWKKSKRSTHGKHKVDPVKLAEEYIKQETAPGTEWEIDSFYTDHDSGMTHVFAVQTIGGIRVDNARFNVNILKDGTIFSSGSSFTTTTSITRRDLEVQRRRQKKLNPLDALKGAVHTLHLGDEHNLDHAKFGKRDSQEKFKLTGSKSHKHNKNFKKPEYIIDGVKGVHSKPEATLTYMQNPDGSLELTWKLEFDYDQDWLLIYADAYEKNKIHSIADYKAHASHHDASYLVYNFNLRDPSEGERTLETHSFKKDASPLGWHTTNSKEFTSLQGNNVIAVINPGADAGIKELHELQTVDGGPRREFKEHYPINSLDYMSWAAAATTQVFYTCNMIHDLFEQLGFTSQAGNFEHDFIGEQGGDGEDPVEVHVLYGAPVNQSNALMMTPEDGVRPRMYMFIFPNPNPGTEGHYRDSSFERDVVIHEYTHGLSTRLTGGPENAACLGGHIESFGMGEGWGDFYAFAVGLKPGDTRNTDYKMAPWLMIPDGDLKHPGIRPWPYSTDTTRNPSKYSTLDDVQLIWGNVHFMGTVWATMLYELLWNLIDKHGIKEDKFPKFHHGTHIPSNGRHLAMKLVMDAMKLQPCGPTFEDARDAIIDADLALTDGDNFCEIWSAFAKRGLGIDAKDETSADMLTPKHIDGFKVPAECQY